MDGRRSAMGLAAGLLLGVAIVAASGGVGAIMAGVPPNSNSSQIGSAHTTTSAAQTFIASRSGTTTSTQPSLDTVGNGSFSSATTTSTTSGTPLYSNVNGLTTPTASAPAYASRVGSLASQPLLTDVVVFVPILLAFLLGAVLYRASATKQEREQAGE